MNKVVLKEYNKEVLLVDIILYSVFVVCGFILLNFDRIGICDPTEDLPYLFYTFSFFSILAYFSNRRKDDYELLIFGLINVIAGTFSLLFINYYDSSFIVSDAVLIYAILSVINKFFSCRRLINNKDLNFFPKASISIVLLFLGVFVVSSLYDKIDVGILILGYYFVVYGLLSLLEPLIAVIIKNKSINRKFMKLLYNYTNEEVIVTKKRSKSKIKKEVIEEHNTKKKIRKETIKRINKK